MSKLQILVVGLGLAAGVAGCLLLWPESRVVRPTTVTPLSNVVELLEWRIDDAVVAADTVVQITFRENRQCSGSFKTDPKKWSNVAKTYKLPGTKGYTKPFLHVESRLVRADGENVAIASTRPLLHSHSDQNVIKFKGPSGFTAVPGEYELQLAIGVEPAESKIDAKLPYEWHVIARCDAEVVLPPEE
jgi:hypothetical protein